MLPSYKYTNFLLYVCTVKNTTMQAIIFSAGLGTRLMPLTQDKPKALVEVQGYPLLEIAIRKLINAGVSRIVINIHHFGGKILDFLEQNDYFDTQILVSDERNLLLETGGGLKKAQPLFLPEQPIVACNADIISSIDIGALYHFHQTNNAAATLAVRQRETSRYLLFDEEKQLVGWTNKKTGEIKESRPIATSAAYAFSGIQVLGHKIFDYMPNKDKFSTIEVFLEMAKKEKVLAYPHDNDAWFDVGKPTTLALAEKHFDAQLFGL